MIYLISRHTNSFLFLRGFPAVSFSPAWTYPFPLHQSLPSCAMFQALYFTQSNFQLNEQLCWQSTHMESLPLRQPRVPTSEHKWPVPCTQGQETAAHQRKARLAPSNGNHTHKNFYGKWKIIVLSVIRNDEELRPSWHRAWMLLLKRRVKCGIT